MTYITLFMLHSLLGKNIGANASAKINEAFTAAKICFKVNHSEADKKGWADVGAVKVITQQHSHTLQSAFGMNMTDTLKKILISEIGLGALHVHFIN